MKQQGIVVLLSGSGTNFQAILDATQAGLQPIEINAVISNNPNVGGLKRASDAGIPAITLDHRAFSSREAYDIALAKLINKFSPKLVVLAGFMRILTAELVNQFEGRMVNIHPALLPKFKGLNTHERAIEAKEQYHGSTVHFVTAELDDGPNIIQAKLELLPSDTADTLAKRVLELEHKIYPMAVEWFMSDRLKMHENGCYFDQYLLPESGYEYSNETTS